MVQQAKQSPLINRFPIHHIPCGLDTELYQPFDPQESRSLLGIPAGKKVLMFAALNLKDYRKGGDLLIQVLQSLPQSLKAETVLLVIGKEGKAIAQKVDIPVYALGYLNNDRAKAVAYSAAALFLFPTRADNSPLVLSESMAGGTPMVGFNVGGVPDLVHPRITGYLVEPENSADFAIEGGVSSAIQSFGWSRKPVCQKTKCKYSSLELIVGLNTEFDSASQSDRNNKPTVNIFKRDIQSITAQDLLGVDAVVHMPELTNGSARTIYLHVTCNIHYKDAMHLASVAKTAGVRRFVYLSSYGSYALEVRSAFG